VAIVSCGREEFFYNAYASTNDNQSGDSYSANLVQ
jgi:hypothetical protein